MVANLNYHIKLDKASLQGLEKVLQEKINQTIENVARNCRPRLQELVEGAIYQSEEAQEVIGPTQLHGELGPVNPAPVLRQVAQTVARSMQIEVRQAQGALQASLTVKIFREDLSEIERILDQAGFYSENTGTLIDWLRWLLTEGTDILIESWHFVPGLQPSRTGLGKMQSGESWHVPALFAGVRGNNFITRALDGIAPRVVDILEEELERNFR
jgi:hypothetical protein